MRISDWSSDVCSSDLRCQGQGTSPTSRAPPARDCKHTSHSWRSSPSLATAGFRTAAVLRRHPVRVYAATTRQPLAQARAPPMQRSEEHTSELQSLMRISYAVFCLKKKKLQIHPNINYTKRTKNR